MRIVLSTALFLASSASVAQDVDLSDIFGGGALEGEALAKATADAAQHPLGSDLNPVRVNMPEGQRKYLSRLRCENGKKPKFSRDGSVGGGPFGSIVDVYTVDCRKSAPGKVAVYMDMYHPEHRESKAVPGFTIVTD